MPAHWTYEQQRPDPATELEQGDILKPTEALRAVFSKVHPHFSNDKYLGFLIATQSCDLVRRQAIPKASYINVATIRPLSKVIHKVLAQVVEPLGSGDFRASGRAEARRLLERLLNQNEQALGLFFLHADDVAGIGEASVAFLRVGVALRAEHYDMLRAARVGRLTPEFRAKLGWLLGNLYDRPGTLDWGDRVGGKKAMEALIDQYLADARWIDDEIVEEAAAWNVEVTGASTSALEAIRPPSRVERAVQEVAAELGRVAPDTPGAILTKLQNRLRNNGKFRKLLR